MGSAVQAVLGISSPAGLKETAAWAGPKFFCWLLSHFRQQLPKDSLEEMAGIRLKEEEFRRLSKTRSREMKDHWLIPFHLMPAMKIITGLMVITMTTMVNHNGSKILIQLLPGKETGIGTPDNVTETHQTEVAAVIANHLHSTKYLPLDLT